jgi:DNA-binding NarL/FixJ family response regulator
LGEADFAAAWADGQTQSLDQALEDAQAVLIALDTHRDQPTTRHGLTARERAVLRLLVAGRSNAQIAEALFISLRTATTHVSNIFAKLGVTTRAQATATAIRDGLL